MIIFCCRFRVSSSSQQGPNIFRAEEFRHSQSELKRYGELRGLGDVGTLVVRNTDSLRLGSSKEIIGINMIQI